MSFAMSKADVHIKLDAQLWHWVKVEAAKAGLKPNEVVAKAIEIMRHPNGAKK